MSLFKAKISGIPEGVSDRRIKELLSSKAKIVSFQMMRSTCIVQLESVSLLTKLQNSTAGSMGLISFLSMDSSGLGELKGAIVSLER
jgi:hypothetical protein